MDLLKSQSGAILGAILVITGVILKNSFEQLKMASHPVGKYGGLFSFVLGWSMVAWYLAQQQSDRNKQQIIYVSALAIVLAVLGMKQNIGMTWLPAVFALAWLTLGFTVNSFQGLIGALSVLISMMLALPWQRKNCVVDGPGLPLFILGWILVLGKFEL